jgi:hypothetical protein
MFWLLLACVNKWEEDPSWLDDDDTGDRSADTDTAGDTSADTDTASDTDTDSGDTGGPVAAEAVGSCVEEELLAGATPVAVTTLWEGSLPSSPAWTTVPATRVVVDAAEWAELQADLGVALGDVDFATARVVALTDWRTATCGLSVAGVDAWAMPDGVTTYVEGRFRLDGASPCEAVCDAEASRVVVVSVPSAGGAAACRRTETWCD